MCRCCQLVIYVVYGIGADPIFSHCSFYQAKRHGIRVIHNTNMPCDCCQHSRCTCVCFPICSTGWIDVRLLMTHKVKLRIVLSTPTEDMGFVWLTAVTQSFPDAQYVMEHGEDYAATIRWSLVVLQQIVLQFFGKCTCFLHWWTCALYVTWVHCHTLYLSCALCALHAGWKYMASDLLLSYGLATLEKCCLSNLETSTTVHCT